MAFMFSKLKNTMSVHSRLESLPTGVAFLTSKSPDVSCLWLGEIC